MYTAYDEQINVKFSAEIRTPSDSMSSSPESESSCPSRYDIKTSREQQTHGRRRLPPIKNNRNSDSEISSPETGSDDELEDKSGTMMYDVNEWLDFDIPDEIRELFNHILSFEPKSIEIEYKLRPFIPNFMPTVGDVDALLKVVPPPPWSNTEVPPIVYALGVQILDDPAREQSEPALLHMQLRATSTIQSGGAPVAIAKTKKDIDKWIADIVALHIARPPLPHVHPLSDSLVEIEPNLQHWSPEVELTLITSEFPHASIDCNLPTYAQAVCNFIDIPIAEPKGLKERMLALYTLFNVYSVIKNLD